MKSWYLVGVLLGCVVLANAGERAPFSDYQRESGQQMLRQLRRDLEEHHYDSALKGVKLGELVQAAGARIAQAQSNAEIFRALASVTRAFDDSHTAFLPPRWGFDFDYGWRAFAAGKACIIHYVKPGSAAERQGVRAGDELLAINGTAVSPETLRSWDYLLFSVEPQQKLTLTLASPGAAPREVTVETKITERQQNIDVARDFNVLMREHEDLMARGRSLYRTFDDVLVWRLKNFTSDAEITEGLAKLRSHSKLVLDLRGNPGGAPGQVLRVIAVLLGKDTRVATKVTRAKPEPVVAEIRREKPWNGKLMVLVDRRSASAAEVLAAAIQQQGRGLLLGDRTAGAVQQAEILLHSVGVGRTVFYGAQVATAEFQLPDGQKIEGKGVTPDFLMPLTPLDLAGRRDPVLSRALKQLGVLRAPEQLADVCWVYDPPEAD